MTIKVTFRAGQIGGTMIDHFDMDLTEFINEAPKMGIDFESILKIEVI